MKQTILKLFPTLWSFAFGFTICACLSTLYFESYRQELTEDVHDTAMTALNNALKTYELDYNTEDQLKQKALYDVTNKYDIDFNRHLEPVSIDNDEEYSAYKREHNKKFGTFTNTWDSFDMYVDYLDDTDDDTASYFRYVASLIPDKLLNKMIDDGWRFVVVDSIKQDEHYITNGTTKYKEKKILIDNDCDIRRVLLHEVGHVAMQYGLKEILETNGITSHEHPELYDTYDEFNADGDLYTYWNYNERISNAFAQYICYPRELKQMAPTLYQCIDTFVATL